MSPRTGDTTHPATGTAPGPEAESNHPGPNDPGPDYPAPGYRTAAVPVRGGTLHVGTWGPADRNAPTVLAVHGVSASHLAWGLVAAHLPGTRVIAPDLRGRGRSNTLPGPCGMGTHAEDLAAVLDALGPTAPDPAAPNPAAPAGVPAPPVAVVGHSMGAYAALALAHRHPGRVSALLLVDGGLPLPVPAGMDDAAIIEAVLGPTARRLGMEFASLEAYRDFWRAHPAFAGHWNALMDDYAAYDLQGEAPRLRPATRFEALAEDTAELHRGSGPRAALEELAHPALLLRSPRGLLNEEPPLLPAALVGEWTARVPRLRTRDVPGTNHYTIVMADPGAAAVAAGILALPGTAPHTSDHTPDHTPDHSEEGH